MSKMTTETNVHTHAEGSVSADMKGKSSPSKSRKCDYIHPCIPYFAKIQAKFGVTPETVDAPKSLIMLSRLAGVDVTAQDLDRSFGALQEKAQPVAQPVAVEVPAIAVAADTVTLPPAPQPAKDPNVVAWITAQRTAGVNDTNIRNTLKELGNTDDQISIYLPTGGK